MLATVVQLSLFLVLQYTTSSLNFLANFDPYYSRSTNSLLDSRTMKFKRWVQQPSDKTASRKVRGEMRGS